MMNFLRIMGSIGNSVRNLFNQSKSSESMNVFGCDEVNDNELSQWMSSGDQSKSASHHPPRKAIVIQGNISSQYDQDNRDPVSTQLKSSEIQSLLRRGNIADSSLIYPQLSANSYRDIGSGGEKFIIPDNDGKKNSSRFIGIYPNKKTSSLALDKEAISRRYKSMKVKDSGNPINIPKSSLVEDPEQGEVKFRQPFLSSGNNQASEVITQNDEVNKPDPSPRKVIFDIPHLVNGKFITSGIISNPLESTYVNRSQIKTGVRPIRGFRNLIEGCRSNQVGTTSYIY
jgi:hypothetical protein